MIIGKVRTITDEWWRNVIRSVLLGQITEINYWTSGWTPDRDDIDEIEVYYEGLRVIRGKFITSYKDSPYRVQKKYSRNPASIGLTISKNNLPAFEKLLKYPFGNIPGEIGNIIFEVEAVSESIIKKAKADGWTINNDLKILEPKECEDVKKVNSRIVYEGIDK